MEESSVSREVVVEFLCKEYCQSKDPKYLSAAAVGIRDFFSKYTSCEQIRCDILTMRIECATKDRASVDEKDFGLFLRCFGPIDGCVTRVYQCYTFGWAIYPIHNRV